MAKKESKRVLENKKKSLPKRTKNLVSDENNVLVHSIEHLLSLCKPVSIQIEREIWTDCEQKTKNQCISNGNSLNFDIFPNIIN